MPKQTKKSTRRKATNPEDREKQLINLAVDCAEKQLRDGTASPSVITHYLKLGSTREELEKAKIEKEIELSRAKTDQIESSKKMEAMYEEALNAMREYSGKSQQEEIDDEEL